jgi:hypothetical protein
MEFTTESNNINFSFDILCLIEISMILGIKNMVFIDIRMGNNNNSPASNFKI